MHSSDTVPGASASVEDSAGIRALLAQQRFAEALAGASAALKESPGHRDLLLYAAVAQRFLGRIDDALATLAELERRHPNFSKLYEERGQCYVVRRDAGRATEAYLRAVHLNHALPSSWQALEGLYRMAGDAENAALAGSHVATLRRQPPEVVLATALFMDGDLDAAEVRIRRFLLTNGDHVEAQRLLARIGIAHRIYDDAELLLSAVLRTAPHYQAARREYADVLIQQHKYFEAREQLKQLMREDPSGRTFYETLYATASVGLGEHDVALNLYTELIEKSPEDADLHLSRAHTLKTLGRGDEAIVAYRRAFQLRPTFGDAYWSLANLKTYRFTDEEVASLRAALADDAARPADRYHLSFALAKALEDRGNYAESFRHYERGNELKRAESKYNPAIIEKNTQKQIEVCTREFIEARRGFGVPDPDPIFIVGLPRSGSTLLEQILASHSRVEGTQELANIAQIVTALRGREPDPENPVYPRVLQQTSRADFAGMGAHYLHATRPYRTGKPFFIDKMPNNFRHLGLIHLILPNAKIIDARREPMACCFSNFKQLFAQGQEFTYGIEDISRYYRTYLELMRHWGRVLPGRILRVQHEDVVDDLEGNVRRILDFCGLDFEPQCVEFHKNQRSVRTASSEQVRQPIFREGLDQWRNFEPWLGPLKEALGDALTNYRDE